MSNNILSGWDTTGYPWRFTQKEPEYGFAITGSDGVYTAHVYFPLLDETRSLGVYPTAEEAAQSCANFDFLVFQHEGRVTA